MPFEELCRRNGIQHQPFNTFFRVDIDVQPGKQIPIGMKMEIIQISMASIMMITHNNVPFHLCGIKAGACI